MTALLPRHFHVSLLLLAGLASAPVAAEAARTIDVVFEPAGDPQIAVWLETADGQFVDTIMVTRLVGTFGLGNRPGRPDFGGGYLWPYGRREMALPIWAHRRNVEYDRLVFQDCKEDWLGWHEVHSSDEPFYCRPVTEAEMNVDTISCPTIGFRTDKGIPLSQVRSKASPPCQAIAVMSDSSLYPPRNDLSFVDPARDWSGVRNLSTVNDLDAVSRATPQAGAPYRVTLTLPDAVADGDYVVWVEVNLEYDTNDTHRYPYFVDPALPDYGQTSLGQPSVVWQVPITIGDADTEAEADSYAGYGSWDGADGNVRPPDATISDAPGSGAGRLGRIPGANGPTQVQVKYSPDAQCAPSPPIDQLQQIGANFDSVTMVFVNTATVPGQVTRYEVRYIVGFDSISSESEFEKAVPGPTILPSGVGEIQRLSIEQLQPNTDYTVAIRTFNGCQEASPIITTNVSTQERIFATVDACFIATAAYGSIDDHQVVALRRFRDETLMGHTVGRLLVDGYYEISPPIADAIRKSDLLRRLTRAALEPVVYLVAP